MRLHWTLIEERRAWRDAREGAYLLRTNLEGQTAEELWTKYIQLTEAEAAFRALKSELAIRPLFHQLEHRTKAHILVAFLGSALWVTLKHLLQRRGTGLTPARAVPTGNLIRSRSLDLLHFCDNPSIQCPALSQRSLPPLPRSAELVRLFSGRSWRFVTNLARCNARHERGPG